MTLIFHLLTSKCHSDLGVLCRNSNFHFFVPFLSYEPRWYTQADNDVDLVTLTFDLLNTTRPVTLVTGTCEHSKLQTHRWITMHLTNLMCLSRPFVTFDGIRRTNSDNVETDRNSVSVAVSAPKLTYNAVSVRFRLRLQHPISHSVSAAATQQTTETGVQCKWTSGGPTTLNGITYIA